MKLRCPLCEKVMVKKEMVKVGYRFYCGTCIDTNDGFLRLLHAKEMAIEDLAVSTTKPPQ